jgi:Fe2+ transport system protein FeoA
MSDTTPDTNASPVLDELCSRCTLADARAGQRFTVMAVDDERARVTALRFGMAEGACVQCVARIPAGPIVLRSGRQEIAVGRGLAERIRIRHHEHGGGPACKGGA